MLTAWRGKAVKSGSIIRVHGIVPVLGLKNPDTAPKTMNCLRATKAEYPQMPVGAEANVCVSLTMTGVDTEFVTRVQDNDIAEAGLAEQRKFRVGTCRLVKGGELPEADLEMDFNLSTVDEARRMMAGDGSGRVQR